jgi:outer membrane protein
MRNLLTIGAVMAFAAAASAQQPERLTLKNAESIAVANHPRVSAAKLTAAAAKQVVTEVKSAYYPQVVGSFTGADAADNSRIGAGALNNPIIYSRFGSGFTASQLITDFGRTGALADSTRLHAAAEGQNAETAREQVIMGVDQAYFKALRAQAVLRVADATVKARQLLADQVSALAKAKLKSALDVSFANVNLSEAKLLLVSAQNDVKAALAELSAAMGYQDERLFELADEPMPATLPASPDSLIRTAFDKRPEVAGAQLEHDSALKFAKSEKDLWLPSLSTVSSVGVIPGHVSNLPDHYAALGINVNLPLFNGHLFAARRHEAELKAEAADQHVRDLQNSIARDIRVAWLNANTAEQRLSLTDQLLLEANQALDLAQARYNIGLSSIVELSQAQLNLTQAQIANVSAKYDYQIRRAVLDYQAGALR